MTADVPEKPPAPARGPSIRPHPSARLEAGGLLVIATPIGRRTRQAPAPIPLCSPSGSPDVLRQFSWSAEMPSLAEQRPLKPNVGGLALPRFDAHGLTSQMRRNLCAQPAIMRVVEAPERHPAMGDLRAADGTPLRFPGPVSSDRTGDLQLLEGPFSSGGSRVGVVGQMAGRWRGGAAHR